MRRVLMMALLGAAATALPAVPAQASLTLIGTFSAQSVHWRTDHHLLRCRLHRHERNAYPVAASAELPYPALRAILGLDGTGSITGFTDSLAGGILTFSVHGVRDCALHRDFPGRLRIELR